MPTSNRILSLLPEQELATVSPILTERHLAQHHVIYEAGSTISVVCFPCDAIISVLVSLMDGDLVEAGCVGCDGALGSIALRGGTLAYSRAIVQQEGDCICCEVKALRGLLPQCATLQLLLAQNDNAFLAQAQQSVACNAVHVIEGRLARWLMRARDLRGSNEIRLTQEYLAQLLAVQRPSVSFAASAMQRAGLIRYSRGVITIVKPEALREMACECYQAVKNAYDSIGKPTH